VTFSFNAFSSSGGNVPCDDLSVVCTGVDSVSFGIDSQRVDEFVVTLDDVSWFGRVVWVEEVQISTKTKSNQVITLPDATKLLIFDFCSEGVGVDGFASFNIPDLGGLVARSGQKLGSIAVETASIDSSRVTFELTLLFSGLSVHDHNFLVRTDTDNQSALIIESDTVDESSVFLVGELEFERRTLEPVDQIVFTTSDDSIRSSLLEGNRGDRLGMASDLTDRSTAIEEESSSELLFSITDGDDSLAVIGPREIADGPAQRAKLDLERMFGLSGVPDANSTSRISRSNVEPAW